jgi:hypothetical protein
VYLDGNEYIVYPDDHNSNLPSGAARTWFVHQTVRADCAVSVM